MKAAGEVLWLFLKLTLMIVFAPVLLLFSQD